jgi:hypothetical protein
MFERRATLVWISGGCLGMCLPIRNPHVDGVWDAMLCAARDFFIIGHLLNANMNEWVEVIAAEAEWASDGHVRLGHFGQYSRDEEGKKSYQINLYILES